MTQQIKPANKPERQSLSPRARVVEGQNWPCPQLSSDLYIQRHLHRCKVISQPLKHRSESPFHPHCACTRYTWTAGFCLYHVAKKIPTRSLECPTPASLFCIVPQHSGINLTFWCTDSQLSYSGGRSRNNYTMASRKLMWLWPCTFQQGLSRKPLRLRQCSLNHSGIQSAWMPWILETFCSDIISVCFTQIFSKTYTFLSKSSMVLWLHAMPYSRKPGLLCRVQEMGQCCHPAHSVSRY